MDYRDAGVDVEAGRTFVEGIRDLVERTYRPEVLGQLGGFSGLFQLPPGYQEPVLVSGTDGVGTKLKLAQSLDRHDTVGIDLVAMCANDVLTVGAEPLFFLDYLATGKLQPEQLAQVVAGIAQGCQLAGCALLGGETAEMPGYYQTGEYDLAGFCVGVAEKSQLITGSKVQLGDIAVGLASRGLHSNGFSLVRKIVGDRNLSWHDQPWEMIFDNRATELVGRSLGDVLLTPTRIYVKSVLSVLEAGLEIRGMAHITGGGLPENLPRCLGPNQSVQLDLTRWTIPAIFDWLAAAGSIAPAEMFNTFNMGIGFVVLVPPEQAEGAIAHFREHDIPSDCIGEVVSGRGTVLGLPN